MPRRGGVGGMSVLVWRSLCFELERFLLLLFFFCFGRRLGEFMKPA